PGETEVGKSVGGDLLGSSSTAIRLWAESSEPGPTGSARQTASRRSGCRTGPGEPGPAGSAGLQEPVQSGHGWGREARAQRRRPAPHSATLDGFGEALRNAGGPLIGEPADLDRRRLAGEGQEAVPGHVHGQVDEDVDPVLADQPCDLLVA